MSRSKELSIQRNMHVASVYKRLLNDAINSGENFKYMQIYKRTAEICNTHHRVVQECIRSYPDAPPAEVLEDVYDYDVPLSDVYNYAMICGATPKIVWMWFNIYYMMSDCLEEGMSAEEALEEVAECFFVTTNTVRLRLDDINTYFNKRDTANE